MGRCTRLTRDEPMRDELSDFCFSPSYEMVYTFFFFVFSSSDVS